MSSNFRNAEKRRENEAAYQREYQERHEREAAMRDKYGAMLARLEELGIDPNLLAEYLSER